MPQTTTRLLSAAALGSLAAVALTAATAGARPSGSAPPCTPKLGTVKGHKAAMNCGPATVALQFKGKTYTFRNGLCESDGQSLILSVGTLVLGVKGNAGLPYIELTILGSHTGSVSEADYGGHQLFGMNLVHATGSQGKSSFKGTMGTAFTGSWNCNGVVYKTP